MQRKSQVKSFIFFSQTGCLIPMLLIFNFFFGWLFLKVKVWLLAEAVLLALFFLNSLIMARKIKSFFRQEDKIIDTEGKIVEDDKNGPELFFKK